ncbi:unnamed protein product [Bursaphelenchus okinawaensis]|uniref:PHD-type domain-containing protein n=1 Tax=Bursaphelenchus okinawaensis TaxID=465554 RepID=A0A811KZ32_9BILA|nr:unnamed protein product [Bursaphelenchus okinawaensis]CAG9114059.1 unnamed protein product [Bursaphelenchus okinawaensis]
MSKARKRKREKWLEEIDAERKAIKSKLNGRYGRKPTESQTEAVLERSTGKFKNPGSVQMQRSLQSHLNKLIVVEEPEYSQQAKWLCCFCHEQSCFEELGDLFGPFFVKGLKPPAYLHKPNREPRDDFDYLPVGESWNYDMWMHGMCAVWTEDLIYFGGKLLNLEKCLEKFWKEKCKICLKIGASVKESRSGGYVHYPCALKMNYEFDKVMMKCTGPESRPPSTTRKPRKGKRSH